MMSSRNPMPTLIAVFALLMAGCTTHSASDETSFDDYLSAMGLSMLSDTDKVKEKARFDDRQRLLSYIESTDLIDLDKVDAKLAAIRSDMLMNRFFEKRYEQEITENTITAYYKSHQDKFTVEKHHLAHILLKVPASANQQERDVAKTTAQEILARLHTGEAFGALAKNYSNDQKTADKGGDLGWAGPGNLSEVLVTASRSLDVDSTPIIVEADYGLHIVKKIASSREQVLSLSEVRPRIIKALRATVKAAEMQRVVSYSKS